MTRAAFTQFSFRGGEWSPFAQGRADIDAYFTALNLCLNYIPLDEGALTRRSGTQFVATAKKNTGARLIPLTGSDGTSYMCEVTDSWVRFYVSGALKTHTGKTVTSISGATPAQVLTSTNHGYSSTNTVIFTPTAGTPAELADLINQQFMLTVVDADEFTIAYTGARSGSVAGSGITWTSGTVAKVEEAALPYLAADLPDIKWTQDAETLYIFHKLYQPRAIATLLNSSTGLFDVTTVTFDDGPYLDENTTTTTVTPGAVSGTNVAFAMSSLTGVNGGQGILATDVGRSFRIRDSLDNWTWVRITTWTDTTHFHGDILGSALATTGARATWRLGLYSDTTGWPTAGEFHEGRLCLVGEVETNRIDGSVVFDPTNFEPTAADGTIADNNSFSFKFAFSGRNSIKWMQSDSNGLLVGTETGEMFVRASNLDDPLTPFSVQARMVSNYGSENAQAIVAGGPVIFIQVLGKIIREMDFDQGSYKAKNIAITGRHLLTEGISEMAFAQTPIPIIWCRRVDKRLIGCCFRHDEEGIQIGWHQHNINYTEDPDNESTGVIEAIGVLPESDNSQSLNDTLWLACNRNGVTCIEYMRPLFEDNTDDTDQFFVDSGVRYTATSFNKNWTVA